MRRNLDLIQKILCWIEEQSGSWCEPPTSLEGFDHERVIYHVHLCNEAGFIRLNDASTRPRRVWLTWAGHEELERARQSGPIQ